MRFGSAEVKKPVSKPISLLRFFDDPQLFGPSFAHGDWTAWKAFIAALFAESSPDEATLAIYRAHTGRTTWPTAPFSEATLIVGRRGGKSRILATIAVYLAVTRNYVPYLAPGELATVAVMAAGVDQARAIFRFVLGLIRAVPLLRKMLLRVTKQRIFLVNRVVIEITPASFRTARGFTFAAVLCDEMAFWRTDEASANPDVEILRAIRPGLRPFRIDGADGVEPLRQAGRALCLLSPALWQGRRAYLGVEGDVDGDEPVAGPKADR
jgi:hypothetical protein